MRQLFTPIFVILVSPVISIIAKEDDAMSTTTSSPVLSSNEPPKLTVPSGKPSALKQRSLFGESCNKTLKCKSRSWLSCDTSVSQCQCTKPDDMIWDSRISKCVGTIGGNCRFGIAGPEGDGHQLYEIAGCVENSFCDLEKDGGTCRCRPTFYGNQEGSKCLRRKDHGLQCNSSMECNRLKRLNCNDNFTCDCEDPSNMLVDQKDGTCKVKIGTDCSIFPNGCFSIATCVASNAETSYKCSCPEGHYSTIDGIRCLPVNKKGFPCTRDVECDAKDRLSCVKNNCSCDPQTSVESIEASTAYLTNERGDINSVQLPVGTCWAKVNTASVVHHYKHVSFQVGQNCTVRQSSQDRTHSAYPDEIYCIPNAFCNTSSVTCDCVSGMTKTGNSMCGNVHGNTCSGSRPCADNLICDIPQVITIDEFNKMVLSPGQFEGTCKCPNPHQQVYDSISQDCRGKPGATCTSVKLTSCIPNASCLQSTRLRYTCECDSGFVERQSSGDCDSEYGHACTQGPPSYATLNCDQEAGLHCIMNCTGTATCLCSDSEDVYEPTRRRCSRPVGLPCMKTEDCITNAYCDDAKGRIGRRCVCNNGFGELDIGRCSREGAV